ncbi:MAG TPA: alpha/beta fold hydrolase [Pseudonocardiaceae bacterium]
MSSPISNVLRTPVSWISAVKQGMRDAYTIYHPQAAPKGDTPAARGLEFEELRITTSRDHVPLTGWVVPGHGPHTVVICHGMGRTKSSVLDHIALLHEAGHHVLAYDLRNHGESGRDGKLGRMADRFTRDLADVLRTAGADPRLGTGKLAVLAFSFSTWPAVYLLRDSASTVSATICDSGPMYDITGGFVRFSGLRWSTLDQSWRLPGAFTLYRWAFRFSATRMLAVRGWPPKLPDTAGRMLFIAGARDRIVPSGDVMQVADAYPHAQRWIGRMATHMNAVRLDKTEYRDLVREFLATAFDSEALRAS